MPIKEAKKKSFSLKDALFNAQKIEYLSGLIVRSYPAFDASAFQKEVVTAFPKLELKERIVSIRLALRKFLPSDYQKATRILLRALPKECDPTKEDGDFGDFIFSPIADFVAEYGLDKNDLDFSLEALKTITTRFSAEYAIRPFINAYPQEVLQTLHRWSQDPHYHVRRLCSEGLRPKLPWAKKITIDPQSALPILDILFSDSTRFVTRSVANHLNDLAKINPAWVLSSLKKWKALDRQTDAELDYMTRHSLRTLVKKGHPQALLLLGYKTHLKTQVSELKLTKKKLKLGEPLSFSFFVDDPSSSKLIIDYRIEFASKTGRPREKIFKLKMIPPSHPREIFIEKRHPLKADMTTHKIYPGKHTLTIQVNGQNRAKSDFLISS